MQPGRPLLVLLLAALARRHCHCLERAELELRLERYADPGQFQQLTAAFYEHLDWIQARLEAEDNMRYIYQQVAQTQLEISARSYAIRRFLAQRGGAFLGRLLEEQPLANYQNNATLREAALELVLARAQLRAKLAMLRANERHWSLLYELMLGYAHYRGRLMGRLNATVPGDALSPELELRGQRARLEAFTELGLAVGLAPSPGRLLSILDEELDRGLRCRRPAGAGQTPVLAAAPLCGHLLELPLWLARYVEPAVLESLRAGRREVEAHLRVTRPAEMPLARPELVERFQRETLELAGAAAGPAQQ